MTRLVGHFAISRLYFHLKLIKCQCLPDMLNLQLHYFGKTNERTPTACLNTLKKHRTKVQHKYDCKAMSQLGSTNTKVSIRTQ